MRSLVIDIGNTGSKYGVFENEALLTNGSFASGAGIPMELQDQVFDHAIVASVAGDTQYLQAKLSVSGRFMELSAQTPLPVINLYETPETLGADRKAGAVGAHYFFPGRNCLVVDAGTCITYDFLDSQGQYHGGGISPGLQMKYKALHNFTGRLPLEQHIGNNFSLVGKTTKESIISGVLAGTVAEVNGIIGNYSQKATDLVVIVCGGDAAFFESNLKGRIFVIPELILIGLQRILAYNV